MVGRKPWIANARWIPQWQLDISSQCMPDEWVFCSWHPSWPAAMTSGESIAAIGQHTIFIFMCTSASDCAGKTSVISKARSIRNERMPDSVAGADRPCQGCGCPRDGSFIGGALPGCNSCRPLPFLAHAFFECGRLDAACEAVTESGSLGRALHALIHAGLMAYADGAEKPTQRTGHEYRIHDLRNCGISSRFSPD